MVKKKVPTTEKGRATRERIIQAATDLVTENGVAGMNLDDIRARTGASRSQIYHYFEDRKDIVHAVINATTKMVLINQGELLHGLDTWAGIDSWFQALVHNEVSRGGCGGCPIGTLVGQLAEKDQDARAAIAEGFDQWEAHLRDGLTRMKIEGKLNKDADPATLATATMASIQGGLLLTQVRRDPCQLRIALDAARNNLYLAKS